MNQILSVIEEVQFAIEGKFQSVRISVEYYNSKHGYYFVSAETETGFDLCDPSQGYFKYDVKRNTGLRTETSIVNEMYEVLQRYIKEIRGIQDKIILTSRTQVVEIRGTECYSSILGSRFFSAGIIHSKQSDESISWYEHDVYKQGELEVNVSRNKEGQLRFHADENALYDFDKLRKLYESEAFQNSKYAFFFYNEVRRLLGMPPKGDPKRMSGLMPSDAQE